MIFFMGFKITNDLKGFVELKPMISQQSLTPRISDLFQGLFTQNKNILQKYISHPHIAWTGSGREALRQILLQLDGENVAVPGYTCHVVLDAIERAGKKPVFYDSSVIADVKDIEKIILKVGTLIVSYNFGFMPNVEKIIQICKKHNVILIEDCAQSLGAKYNEKLVGSFGDYAFYSFGISKNIGFCGGLITSKNKLRLQKTREMPFFYFLDTIVKSAVHSFFFHPFLYKYTKKYLQEELEKIHPPLAYKLPAYAKNVILHQCKRYNKILKRRQRNAMYCIRELEGAIDFVNPLENSNPSWLYFVIKTNHTQHLIKKLVKEGIELGEMHTFQALSSDLPKSLDVENKILTFSLYRKFSEIKKIVKSIKNIT
jgi:dTDP-4-amino-4,6-dideoxygalactose transaminase